jgi:hypothetical protein
MGKNDVPEIHGTVSVQGVIKLLVILAAYTIILIYFIK